MRKTIFVYATIFSAALFSLTLPTSASFRSLAQDSTPAALPGDPKALMLLAAKTNGLTSPDVQPWHAKATWKSLDEQGNTTDQGTFEEFWVSPAKYKRTLAGTAYTQTEYGADQGPVQSVTGRPNFQVGQMLRAFFDPLPSQQAIEQSSYDLQQRKAGSLELACLELKDAYGNRSGLIWCLDSDKPYLRITAMPSGQQIFQSRLLEFQGRIVAGDLQFTHAGKLVLSFHVENLDPLAAIDDALFLPPSDAKPSPRTITVSPGVAKGFLLKGVAPVYPLYAKETGIKGTVVLQAIIGKDGHIKNLRVFSGPKELQQAALDAVKQWLYRPYLLNNEPVEVDTTINVIFTLGR
jgi:TonB family protein